jgi:transglutaminase-like putative cysteine protease
MQTYPVISRPAPVRRWVKMPAMILGRRRRAFFLAGSLLLNAARLSAAEGNSFTIKGPGSWVQIAAVDDAAMSAAAATGKPTKLLDDHQTRVTDRSVERYVRHAQIVAAQKDLEELSQIQIEFEPSYQSLTIHHIQIRRNAAVINAFHPGEIQLLHREKELDQQIFDGSIQAVAILRDVRLGDVIDYAYTLTGDNPVARGKFAQTVQLESDVLVKRLRVRLLWPQNRKLFMRPHNTNLEPKITPGDEVEYIWERNNVVPMESEGNVPGWYDWSPWVDVSEFETWSDVVAWALPIYKIDSSASPDLLARIDAISKSVSSQEGRLLAALRLVQEEVRYLGIEMGPYSHQPTEPSRVWARRFGDCKDKALLLTVILHAFGIDAAPALVNTESGKMLDSRQPSPYTFDHAIVNVRLDGKTYWLDGTQTYQRGGLADFYDPPYARALVLRAGTKELEEIPLEPRTKPTTFAIEHYRFVSLTDPVSLTVVTTYSGEDADEMRYDLARSTPEKLSQDYLNFYATDNPKIESTAAIQIKDDESTNTLVVTEQYSIPDFWKDSIHDLSANRIVDLVRRPTVSRRSMPLRVRFPLNVRQRIEVETPFEGSEGKVTQSFHDKSMDFQYTGMQSGKTLVLEYSLKTVRDHVPVPEVPEHLVTLDNISNNLSYRVRRDSLSMNSSPTAILPLLALIGLIVGGVAIAGVVKRRRGGSRDRFISRVGESPSSAIAVSDNDAMLRHLLRLTCRCGKRLDLGKESMREETVVYDGRRITVFRIRCASCRSDMDVHFKEDQRQAEAH